MTSLARAVITATVVSAEGIAGPSHDAPWSIRLLKSPSFRVLTKSAHLALARIAIELAAGRNAVTHRSFQRFGIARDSVTHAIVELEALGIITVQRCAAKANTYDLSHRWRGIASIEQAVAIRDRARHFGLCRRRKVERMSARIDREQRLTWIKAALDTPHQEPILAELDDVALKVLQAVIVAIESRSSVNYSTLCERVGVGRNRLALSLRLLRETGLIVMQQGRRRCTYRIGPWHVIGVMAARERP